MDTYYACVSQPKKMPTLYLEEIQKFKQNSLIFSNFTNSTLKYLMLWTSLNRNY